MIASTVLPSIPTQRRPRGEEADELLLPSSFAQQNLWALDRRGSGSLDCNVLSAFRLDGNLDIEALTRSFSFLVRRHEVLRTTFKTIADQPLQFVAPAQKVMVPVTDLRGVERVERAEQERRLITEEAWASFDLSRGPLMRVRILRTGDSEHVLIKVRHLITGDGWSDDLFLRELITAYEAFTEDHEPQLPELQIQYGDFAQRQRELLQGESLARELEYWRGQLADLPGCELPTDRPRQLIQTFSGGAESFELPAALTGALRNLSTNEHTTLFVTLLTGLKVLLMRYCGQEDLVVGTPMANRGRGEIDRLIGLFANTVVMRTKLDGDPTFRGALERVNRTVQGSMEHLDLPIGRLVEELAPQKAGNQNPFFQVMFDLVKAYPQTWKMGKVNLVPIGMEKRGAKFDLRVELTEGVEMIRGSLNYNRDLFDASTIGRMAGHFRTLLEGIAANPEARISKLPILTSAERRQLLVERNDTGRVYPTNVGLHEFIEAQVDRSPDAIAVVCEDEYFSYCEVNRRANRLAHRLRKLGIGPNAIVGIFAERSVEMIVGLVAVLKAGGAYLPLDPNYPAERLEFMLGDANPAVVLVQSRLEQQLPEHSAKVVLLEDDFAAESEMNPVHTTNPQNLAYVIYTSGSTGRPKGVMFTHGGICNWLLWVQETCRATADDRIIHKTPFTFDVSLGEIFWSLLAGSQLVVAQPDLHGDSRYLTKMIREKKITVIHFVPSMLSAFLEDQDAARCESLRLVICAGEALSVELQERFFAALPNAELHNQYGPTEAGVVTYWKCKRGSGERTVPIGWPIANTQMYILDRAMEPVPAGIVGELYIGGVQVARGYLARPELTGKVFVPNPFGEDRLYKTGDLARYRTDGAIEFLGRNDHQVKLRGQRIELGEIEAVIKKHEAVRECVVMLRQDGDAPKRLVAYMVASGLSPQEARQHTTQMLPGYMVPSAFVILQELPLTASGKLDRRALPEPVALAGANGSVPPRDTLETQLVAMWEKALKLQPIGITDNFFELGGNSLQAMSIFAEIEQTFGKRLPLATLLKMPTVETLAPKVRQATGPEDWSPLVPIQLQGTRPPFFAVHGRNGNVLFYRKFSQLLGKRQPFYGLQAEGLDGTPITPTSIEAIAASYLKEMRKVQPHGPYLLGGYSSGGVTAYEIARHLRATGEEVALLVLFDSYNPAVLTRVRTRARVIRSAIRSAVQAPSKITVRRVVQFFGRHVGGQLPELLDRQFELVHERAVRAYRPLSYAGKVTLFRTQDQGEAYEAEPDLGWGAVAKGGAEVHYVPGMHLSVFSDENVSDLAKKVDECIELALSER
jgi:amino acid adenylation domain-containing protein